MAYAANYEAADMSEVVIDNIVGIGAALFSFVSLIGIVLLYRWLKKR
jgi:hypothetical protein